MGVRNRVGEIRRERGLTITQVAMSVGTSRSTIYSIERVPGYRVSLDVMTRLAKVLEVTVDELLEPERVA